MKIAVVNESTVCTDAEVAAWVPALKTQALRDFCPAWGVTPPEDVYFTASPAASDWLLVILDTSDQAGALGYHDLTAAGLPLSKVFAASDKQVGDSVSVTASHEHCEMLGDPWIDSVVQGPDGVLRAFEAADACEDDQWGYEIDGVKVSDFVYPAWFGSGSSPAANGSLDFQGHIQKVGELLAGGYIGVLNPSQGWTQVTAGDEKAQAKAVPPVGSRRERRARGSSAWQVSAPPAATAASRPSPPCSSSWRACSACSCPTPTGPGSSRSPSPSPGAVPRSS